MDELEKNVPEAENKDEDLIEEPVQADEAESANALETELEEIRDMFQTELDKAMNEEPGEVLIQELDEIEDEEPEETEKRICECCGENECDTSFGEDYPYCTQCRELMKANPLNAVSVIMAVVMFLVAGLSLGFTVKNIDTYMDLLDANTAYSEKRLVDAITDYDSYLGSVDANNSVSMRAVKNAIDIMTDLGYYTDANDYVDNYFSGFALRLPWNKKYSKIKENYDLLMASSEVINENFGDALNGKEFDFEKEIKKADKLIAENEESGQYSQTFLEYAKYLLMLVNEESDEDQLEQLLKIEEIDGGKFPWIYVTYTLNTYANMGDKENAKKYFDRCISVNAQEMNAYTAYANAIRFSENPDADEMLELAREAANNASTNSYPTYYRIYAIAYLLEGDAQKAMNSMTQYIQSCQQSVSDFNLYAVCAIAAGEDDGYKQAEETLKMYGYKLGPSVVKYKKGKLTAKQVLLEKGGDV